MTIPLWGILFLIVMPFLLAGHNDVIRYKKFGTFDNNYPREQTAQLSGLGARVWAAQLNAWEALAIYTPSVLVAHIVGVDPAMAAKAAIIFCAARVFHAAFYILNISPLRSLSYFVALGCSFWLFWMSGQVQLG